MGVGSHRGSAKGRKPRISGFTLIELMVTISIAAIMLALAAPSFQSLIRNTYAQTVSTELATTLGFARSEAIKRGWRVVVCKSSAPQASSPGCDTSAAWNNGWVVFVDKNENGTVDSGEALRVGQPANTRVAITGDTNFASSVTYLPTGYSSNATDGSLTFCIEGVMRKVTINTTGHLHLDAGAC
jgi:type IV fimbrial biogenesis protein FimT